MRTSFRGGWLFGASAALMVVGLMLQGGVARAAVVTLALTGDAAPGGGQYFDFSLVKLNDAGQVGFNAITNANFIDHGVFRAQAGGPTTLVARSGQSSGSGAIGSVTFIDINNHGQVVMQAELFATPGGGNDNRAIYLGSGGPLQQVARKGHAFAVPDVAVGLVNHQLTSIDDLSFFEGRVLNDAGQVAFTGSYRAEQPIINGTTTVYRIAGLRANAGGTISVASEVGSAAPTAGGGTAGTIGPYVGPPPINHNTALVNAAGHTLFRAGIAGTGDEGLFWSNTSSVPGQNRRRAVARDGQTLLPGAPGTMKLVIGTPPFIGRMGVDMNDAGEVAFLALLNPGSPGNLPDLGVYRWSPTAAAQAGAHGLTEIARKGTPAPGGDGVLDYLFFADVQLNNRGQAVFQSSLKNSSFGPEDYGVFRGDGDELTTIARMGTPTPDGALFLGLPGASTLASDISINDSGQVAFTAPLRNANGDFVGHGIYISDGVEIVEATRTGQALGSSVVDFFAVMSERGINRHGQVAFNASLENGRNGVFLFTQEDVRWRFDVGGAWDDNRNWTLSTTPANLHRITIAPAAAATILGPAANTTVRSLALGDAGPHEHVLALQSGVTLTALEGIALGASSVLDFAADSAGTTGKLATWGALTLGGTLRLSLPEGIHPYGGQAFDLFDATSTTGAFAAMELPELADGLIWSTSQLVSQGRLFVTVEGDFDGDRDVDAEDLTVWQEYYGRRNLSPGQTGPDAGKVLDGGDFLGWQRRYITAEPPSSFVPVAGPVPEPASWALAGAALAATFAWRAKRRFDPMSGLR
ncbi:MAG: PEP-CTERM sorting domain-containing protein [Pirellulales bacterium]|nr:PEP-CTERM sorting domain-containing protein [Pirellulales bacterium]